VMHRIQCAGDVPALAVAAKAGHPRARLTA
jgi:hypothetical protein